MNWSALFAVITSGFVIFLLYRTIRANPEMLSKDNLLKSFGTMGFLALGLIAFVGILVWMLRV